MKIIPHSYPFFIGNEKEMITKYLDKEYIGYSNELNNNIKDLLKEFFNYNFVFFTPSASLSLLLILKIIKRMMSNKNEIIISGINCWSVYNTLKIENFIPIIVDIRNKKDFRTSYEKIKKKITENTAVIIITHMFGAFVEEKIIKQLKNEYPNIIIIEDFSTSFMGQKNLGNYSDFGIVSFGSTKPISAGCGGALLSNFDVFNEHYDSFIQDKLTFNIKTSVFEQLLLINQLRNIKKINNMRIKILSFYKKFLNIYNPLNSILFRIIIFEEDNFKNLKNLEMFLQKYGIKLDKRESVQPNLIKELKLSELKNAFYFKKYYSMPNNFLFFKVLKEKGLINE